jgi:hypothetical protein
MLSVMAVRESLRRLDERVYGPPENDLPRAIRYLPWLLAAALIAELVARTTDSEVLHGLVLSFLSGSLVCAVLIARATRQAPRRRTGRVR